MTMRTMRQREVASDEAETVLRNNIDGGAGRTFGARRV